MSSSSSAAQGGGGGSGGGGGGGGGGGSLPSQALADRMLSFATMLKDHTIGFEKATILAGNIRDDLESFNASPEYPAFLK